MRVTATLKVVIEILIELVNSVFHFNINEITLVSIIRDNDIKVIIASTTLSHFTHFYNNKPMPGSFGCL